MNDNISFQGMNAKHPIHCGLYHYNKPGFCLVDSYDTKNWPLLRTCLAPSSRLDFRSLQGALHENLSPDEYVAILEKTIGDARLKTQHLIGATTWTYLVSGSVEVIHQLRVAHQRYTDEKLGTVANKGHAHGYVVHKYSKFHGEWKIEEVQPKLEWTEYDLYGTLSPPETA
ncbi:scytalone dehydratase [Cordyceps militaris]|uniref:Scytalone dehydratase n=1 Tax=Cordyceps militaris TaxID=73501 RepID=A0A2H4SDS5_CORMI|nr:scytalone dehydratase [Cordyceps militaris]